MINKEIIKKEIINKETKDPEPGVLYQQLERYRDSDFYPFHMPGHKRQSGLCMEPYGIDITEIEGFDNLHHAEGILLDAQRRAARLYHAEETFYLVNGSTCGILAAVSAAVPRGKMLLMARNCHKAAYHAVLLRDLQAEYLYPQADMVRGINGAVSVDAVREALRLNPEIRAVLVTSPTYDGIVSDIRGIADAVHTAGKILIVDEAHGAHFGMHPYFPEHALSCGADLVINSVHKTLPAMTQTALLHVQGERVDRERLRRYLGIFQSSSPSYVLMAGIDNCVHLLEQQGEQLFSAFVKRLSRLRERLSGMQVLHLVDGTERELYCFDFDRSKVLISTERSMVNGSVLCRWLRERYHLEMEMEAEHYVTAITTIADTCEGMQRFGDALLEIDNELAVGKLPAGSVPKADRKDPEGIPGGWHQNEAVMRIAAASDARRQQSRLEASCGRISAEFVYLYPPGIPLLVPGERITQELLDRLYRYRSLGMKLQGLADYRCEEIFVVAEP